MTSPPPLLLTVADTWLLSLTRNNRTVDEVSVLRSMPPQLGRITSAVTGASSATLVAAFAGFELRTDGCVPLETHSPDAMSM